MAKRIIIAVTNDLVTDRRVHRVAETLSAAGYQICLAGRQWPHSESLTLPYKTRRFKLCFNKGALFYANYNLRLFFYLLFRKFDAVLANDLDTLPASFLAAKIRGKQCIYDSHEYFTEVPELVHRKFQKRTWERMEQLILPRIKQAYTVSPAIADAYFAKYGVPFKVVRNLPNKYNPQPVQKEQMLIYQGALNMGRGIELMIQCMAFLPDYILLIAGAGDIEKELQQLAKELGLEKQVQFLGRLLPDELTKITAKAQLGLSWEEDLGLNYRFALPNKLFDYIQARVPVMVSDLPEMRNIIEKYQVGEVIKDRTPQKLAQQITEILSNEELSEARHANIEKAAQELNWENEQEILLELFKNAIPLSC